MNKLLKFFYIGLLFKAIISLSNESIDTDNYLGKLDKENEAACVYYIDENDQNCKFCMKNKTLIKKFFKNKKNITIQQINEYLKLMVIYNEIYN